MVGKDSRCVIDWAVARSILPGETESGDLHLVTSVPHGALTAVVDGLGHGPEAAAAARKAIATLEQHPQETLIALLQRCHEALRGTRGVVISMAFFHAVDQTLTWLGVGDVEGVLVRGDTQSNPPREALLQRGGVVGFQIPTPRASVMALGKGDTIVFATDGIRTGWAQEVLPMENPQRIADRICSRYNKGTDDALVLVARYRG